MLALVYSLVCVCAVVLQLTFVPFFSVWQVSPNLVLIVVIIMTLHGGRVWGIAGGFAVGLVLDFFGTGFVGVSSLANTLAAFVAGFLWTTQFQKRFLNIMAMLFTAILVHDLVYFFITRIGSDIGFFELVFSYVIPTSIYTLIFVTIVYLVFPKLILDERRGHF